MSIGQTGVFAAVVALLAIGCGSSAVQNDSFGEARSELRGGGGKPDPCATVRCAAGTHCESKGRKAECVADPVCLSVCADGSTWDQATCQCVPNPVTCANVVCGVGTVCVETSSGPTCQPQVTAECQSDFDCRLESNFCGGCSCLALGAGESGPTCDNPVLCFADPCSVTTGSAVCEAGQCVIR